MNRSKGVGNYSLLLSVCALAAGGAICLNAKQSQAETAAQEVVDLDTLAPAAREIAVQVPQARAILEDWRKENAEEGNRFLHIVYWTPLDKPAAPDYQRRLQEIFVDIQEYYRGQMEKMGFGSDLTVGLDWEKKDSLKIHYVQGLKNYDQYENGSGAEIRKECLNTLREAGVDAANETLVIFCNMSEWDAEKRTIRQNSPYYARGSSVEGTAWQVDSPILELKQLMNNGDNVFDGQYGDISLGKYNTIFIGGIVHELGHAFGLPHNLATQQQAEEFGVALMGSGNRAYKDELRGDGKGAFITLAHGLKLASHPMFSGHTARMHEDPQTKVEGVTFEPSGKGFVVKGKVTGEIPPYAVLAYMNPEGGQDYDATTATCIPNAEGQFEIDCQALAPGKAARLHLVFLHANGKASSNHQLYNQYSYPYSVDSEGQANIDSILLGQEVAAVVNAIKQGEADPLQSLSATASDEARQLAQRLVASKNQQRQLPAPSEVDAELESVVLTDCQYESVSVGYGRPSFDRSSEESMVLASAAGAHKTGVFVHAPSQVVYRLDGKWGKLSGSCGLLEQAYGSVSFQILADGKLVFQTPVMRNDTVEKVDIDLSGVQTIELITTDGGDGMGSDWSAWLDMELSR